MARLPMAIPPDLERLTPDVPKTVFDATFRLACERLDRFVGALSAELAVSLELPTGEWTTPHALGEERKWAGGTLPVEWLLGTLELYGAAECRDESWRITSRPAGESSARLREAAEEVMPAARPAYEVLSLSAQALPAVLRGELRGEDALFGPAAMGLWFEYFSNANPHYAPNNLVTAIAVERAVGTGARVLEVGGGGGSAAQALLEALGRERKPPSAYTFTELQPAFLRRGVRAVQKVLPAGCQFTSLRFDIDGEPGDQGFGPGQFDAVFGVNTLHLAREVVPTLRRLRRLLRPDGALVIGELLRPTPTQAVHLELPFTLLTSYACTPVESGIRARPGFMSARGWRRALEAAGFREITLLPAEIERCAGIYPGFYCGALTARA